MNKFVRMALLLLLVSAIADSFSNANAANIYNIEPNPIQPFIEPTKGQSEMTHWSRPGDKVYTDWIVTSSNITLGIIDDSDLVFADILGYTPGDATKDTDGTLDGLKGTVDLFKGSAYFYFYQVENPMVTNATAFALNLDPHTVLTAGYINANYDLDTDFTIQHNISYSDGTNNYIDYEGNGGLVPVTDATFDPEGTATNMAINFTIPQGSESYVFFVTCIAPPKYDISSAHAGAPALEGELPIPADPLPPNNNVPEPTTMILLASSFAGYLLRRSKK